MIELVDFNLNFASLYIQISTPMQKQSFGMMDQGYFVPRTEIIDWINNLLNLNLNKIEQLGSGAVYCQIIDVIHPGKVALSKVNWRAKNDYEFIANLKLLQAAFDKIGIKRYVEVEKLARAKYQDNLEFIQWLKRYYDINCGERGNNYMADQKRGSVPVDFSFAEKNVVPKSFNGSGQVIPKTEKVQAPKKEPSTNIVSAVAAYRNENKSKERKKQNVVHSSNKKPEPKADLSKAQKQKIKQLEDKLAMIRQIAESDEAAESRMKLIEEVLNINSGNGNGNGNGNQEGEEVGESENKMEEEIL